MEFWYVNAFTTEFFKGNPAGVFILDHPLAASEMQDIARCLNLSESAFVTPKSLQHYDIRWFSPKDEAPLCGHATIAAAHILNTTNRLNDPYIKFDSIAGELGATCNHDDSYTLDFPEKRVASCPLPDELRKAMGGVNILEVYKDELVYLLVLESPEAVKNLSIDLGRVLKVPCRAVIVTSHDPGEFDFVSRYFAPSVGIPEDPVCGSAHCRLTPFWGERLSKSTMIAFQASKRTGVLEVSLPHVGRVCIAGKAVTVAKANFEISLLKKNESKRAA